MFQQLTEKLLVQPTDIDREFQYCLGFTEQDHESNSLLCGVVDDFQSSCNQSQNGSAPLFPFKTSPKQSEKLKSDAISPSGFQKMVDESQSASESHDGMNKRKSTQRMKLNKRIAKRYQEQKQSDEEEEDEEESFTVNKHTSKKKKTKKLSQREQYPTKNFLPTFRTSFINYLEKNYKDEENQIKFLEVPVIQKIKRQKCINLKDYEEMFNQKIFRPILQRYFDERIIYRDLMGSRVNQDLKKIYQRKLWVFGQAFKTGVFEKINYHQRIVGNNIAE